MKLFFVLSTFLATTGFAVASPCDHSETTFRCLEYVRNYDGDTITFQIPNVHPLIGSQVSVRLKGVDTPEISGSKRCEKQLAVLAKNFVREELSQAREIELHEAERGKYFRILGLVSYDGDELAERLISEDLALPYDGGSRDDHEWCDLLRRHRSSL